MQKVTQKRKKESTEIYKVETSEGPAVFRAPVNLDTAKETSYSLGPNLGRNAFLLTNRRMQYFFDFVVVKKRGKWWLSASTSLDCEEEHRDGDSSTSVEGADIMEYPIQECTMKEIETLGLLEAVNTWSWPLLFTGDPPSLEGKVVVSLKVGDSPVGEATICIADGVCVSSTHELFGLEFTIDGEHSDHYGQRGEQMVYESRTKPKGRVNIHYRGHSPPVEKGK